MPKDKEVSKVEKKYGEYAALLEGKEGGFTPVLNRLIDNAGRVGVKPIELSLIVTVLSFQKTEKWPYPSMKAVGRKMGIKECNVWRHAQELMDKGFLKRERIGRGRAQTWDFSPLYEKLLSVVSTANSQVQDEDSVVSTANSQVETCKNASEVVSTANSQSKQAEQEELNNNSSTAEHNPDSETDPESNPNTDLQDDALAVAGFSLEEQQERISLFARINGYRNIHKTIAAIKGTLARIGKDRYAIPVVYRGVEITEERMQSGHVGNPAGFLNKILKEELDTILEEVSGNPSSYSNHNRPVCRNCNGERWVEFEGAKRKCPICEGTGYEPCK